MMINLNIVFFIHFFLLLFSTMTFQPNQIIILKNHFYGQQENQLVIQIQNLLLCLHQHHLKYEWMKNGNVNWKMICSKHRILLYQMMMMKICRINYNLKKQNIPTNQELSSFSFLFFSFSSIISTTTTKPKSILFLKEIIMAQHPCVCVCGGQE